MNILAILPHSIGGRLTTQSIIDGFLLNEHEVRIYDELYDDISVFENYVKNEKFDYMVGYDYSPIHLKLTYNLKIKTINYFSDLIEEKTAGYNYDKYFDYLNDDDNYTFYWDKEDYERLKDRISNFCYLPHFVNVETYKNENKSRNTDIMFAGRLDTDYRLNMLLAISKTFHGKNISWFAIKRHYDDAYSRCDDEGKAILQKIYKGFISTEKDMARELNNSKIVINFHSQGKSAVNYRTFQAMACGCVVISDLQKEMNDLFEVDENIVCYENFNSLIQKINFYLKDEKQYQHISQNAQECVKKYFNAKKGVNTILDNISEKMAVV